MLAELKKNDMLTLVELNIKEGGTSPPKRYIFSPTILTMENVGQLVEDEGLRAQIEGSGIGTSTTRTRILKKLFSIEHLNLDKKTRIITPSLLRKVVYDMVDQPIRQLLNPELTVSWEKGLTYVTEGSVASDGYMEKLSRFAVGRTVDVIHMNDQCSMRGYFDMAAALYKTKKEN